MCCCARACCSACRGCNRGTGTWPSAFQPLGCQQGQVSSWWSPYCFLISERMLQQFPQKGILRAQMGNNQLNGPGCIAGDSADLKALASTRLFPSCSTSNSSFSGSSTKSRHPEAEGSRYARLHASVSRQLQCPQLAH